MSLLSSKHSVIDAINAQLTVEDLYSHFHPDVDFTGEGRYRYPSDKESHPCPVCGGNHFSILTETESGNQIVHCFNPPAQQAPQMDAVALAAKLFDLEVGAKLFEAISKTFSLTLPAARQRSTAEKLFQATAEYYSNQLMAESKTKLRSLGNRTPLEYQQEVRGHRQETLGKFLVGWSDGRLVDYLVSVHGVSEQDVLEAGLARETKNGIQDYFPAGLFIYPNALGGQIVDFTMKDPSKNLEFRLQKASKLKPVQFYNQSSVERADVVFIVEGENDLLSIEDLFRTPETLKETAKTAVIASNGVLSSDQLIWLQNSLVGKRIVTIFDADEAGDKYRQKLQNLAHMIKIPILHSRPAGKEVDGVQIEVKDIDDSIRKLGLSFEGFKAYIKECAVTVGTALTAPQLQAEFSASLVPGAVENAAKAVPGPSKRQYGTALGGDLYLSPSEFPDVIQNVKTGALTVKAMSTKNLDLLLDIHHVHPRLNLLTQREVDEQGGNISLDAVPAMIRAAFRNVGVDFKKDDVVDRIKELARKEAFHPIKEYVEGGDPSGEYLLDAVFETLEISESAKAEYLPMYRRWFEKFCMGVIKKVYHPKTANSVLILLGDQGKGKSRWCEALLPVEGACTGGKLDPSSTDHQRRLTEAVLWNIEEADATFRSRDAAAIKAFVTQTFSRFRKPYEHSEEQVPTQCSFVASANDTAFLSDETGNRRFLVMEVIRGNADALGKLDLRKFWSQIYQKAIVEGARTWFDEDESEEISRVANSYLAIHNTGYESLLKTLQQGSIPVTAVDLAEHVLRMDPCDITRPVTINIGKTMSKLGFVSKQAMIGGRKARYFFVDRELSVNRGM